MPRIITQVASKVVFSNYIFIPLLVKNTKIFSLLSYVTKKSKTILTFKLKSENVNYLNSCR